MAFTSLFDNQRRFVIRRQFLSHPITTTDIVIVDIDSKTKEDATRELADRLLAAGRVTDVDTFLQAVAKREEHFPTGIEGGIAIPHAQSDSVKTPSVAVATSKTGIDFGADDGPSTLIFLIAAPASGESAHLEILGSLARKVMHEDFCDALRAEKDPSAIAEIVTREVQN
jgi:fructose-specific phosphotransferase system IIA component